MTRNTIAIGFMMLVASVAYSENLGSISQPMIVEQKVGIKNLAPTQTSFQIKKSGGKWLKYSLGPNRSEAFPCGQQCDFSVGTKGKPSIQRRLSQTKRYGIYWDSHRQVWDIGEASN